MTQKDKFVDLEMQNKKQVHELYLHTNRHVVFGVWGGK
jgi:hypothetical protein